LTLTMAPGLAVDATADGGAEADGAAADAGALAGVPPPHAPAASATTAVRATNGVKFLLRMRLPFPSFG
jgi:hypothetical protein